MSRKKKSPKFVWTPEEMRVILERRRSNASQKHLSKRAYRRRDKYNRRDVE